jgi:mRNA interferase RelE/StbE
MMKRYDVWVEPAVHQARKQMPGRFRQRVKRAIAALADDPRPPKSRPLDVSDLDVPPDVELRRIRMDPWRMVYAVNDAEAWVWVLAVRKRPPYDYEDLEELLAEIG